MARATVDSKNKLEAQYGKSVRLVGTYRVQDLGGHAIMERQPDGSVVRRRQVAFVELSGGALVSLARRSDEEMQALDGKQVEVLGTLQAPLPAGSPSVARPNPMPSAVDIKSVEPIG